MTGPNVFHTDFRLLAPARMPFSQGAKVLPKPSTSHLLGCNEVSSGFCVRFPCAFFLRSVLNPSDAFLPRPITRFGVAPADVKLHRKALQQRGAEPFPVTSDFRFVANAARYVLAAWAQIHGGQNPSGRYPTSRTFSAVQIKHSCFHDVPERFPRRPVPFRQFVEKQHPSIGQSPRSWDGLPTPPRPEKPRGPTRRMRGVERSLGVLQKGGSAGQTRFSDSGRASHQDRKGTLCSDAQPLFGVAFTGKKVPILR